MLLDSGASVTLVDPDIPYIREEECSIRVKYANGNRSILTKKRFINIIISNSNINIWAYVAPNLPTDIILGRDIMTGNISLDFIKKDIIFRKGFLMNDVIETNLYADYDSIYSLLAEENHKTLDKLNSKQKDVIYSYMKKFNERYTKNKWIVSDRLEEFSMDFVDDNIPYGKPYIYHGIEYEFLVNQIKEWLDLGIIRPSNSKYAVPLLVSTKIK